MTKYYRVGGLYMGVLFRAAEAVKLLKVRMENEETFYNCFLDVYSNAPRGFLGVRCEDDPNVIKYIKVSNILFFEIDEKHSGQLWSDFQIVLPEMVHIKTQ